MMFDHGNTRRSIARRFGGDHGIMDKRSVAGTNKF